MDIKIFSKQMCEILKDCLGDDYQIAAERSGNMKGILEWQLKIQRHSEKSSVYINLEERYKDFQSGDFSIPDMAYSILHTYNQSREQMDSGRDICSSLETAKGKIYYRLMNYDMNKQRLQNLVHIRILDLAIVFAVVLSKTEMEIASIPITKEMQDRWKCSTKCLYQLAEENTVRLFPKTEEKITEVLCRMFKLSENELLSQCDAEVDIRNLHVLTNEMNCNGAAALLYPKALQGAAERFQDDLVIFPSSIHEVLLMPVGKIKDFKPLNQLVREINENYVEEGEILADHIYLYNRNAQELINCDFKYDTWEVPV